MTYLGPGRTSVAARIWIYVCAMFPLHVRVPINFLNFSVIYAVSYGLLATGPIPLTWKTAIAALTVQILWLLIRVFDEAKDYDSDVELARQGDARFMNRPLVTGKVLLSDITSFKWFLLATVVLMNAATQSVWLICGLAVALLYLGLTSKWLFYPKIKDHVIAVYITHMPNVLVIIAYSLCAAMDASSADSPNGASVAICIALWFTVGAYEFAYKIRSSEQETDLLTYSKVLGLRTASFICGSLVIASGVFYGLAIHELGQIQFSMMLVAAAALLAIPCFDSALTGRLRRSLTAPVGAYWYLTLVAATGAAVLQKGVAMF